MFRTIHHWLLHRLASLRSRFGGGPRNEDGSPGYNVWADSGLPFKP